MNQIEGTNKLIQDTSIEELQFILQADNPREVTYVDAQAIARDLITLYEVLAEDNE